MAKDDIRKLSLEELRERRDELAKQRTEVRLAQNEVADEIVIRENLESLPASARDALLKRITVGGKVGLEGDMGGDAEETDE